MKCLFYTIMRGLCMNAEPSLPFSFCPWSNLKENVSSSDYVLMRSIQLIELIWKQRIHQKYCGDISFFSNFNFITSTLGNLLESFMFACLRSLMINKEKTPDRNIEALSLGLSFSSYFFLHLSIVKLSPRNFKVILFKHLFCHLC